LFYNYFSKKIEVQEVNVIKSFVKLIFSYIYKIIKTDVVEN